ncbi:hypothetical protein Vadar_032796 [Vaccinium darrowii]|uniref:Uncharacterized protein n=1 Tax=Vaccinium darrowii TaxID=229202 RepID=A0ACB7XVS3_9ERIC|nr:hypothetical protein Vadar_032796 [Vaccinium darrowii]
MEKMDHHNSCSFNDPANYNLVLLYLEKKVTKESVSYLLHIIDPNACTVYVVGKDLLSLDLGASVGAGNNTITEASKSPNTRKKEIDLPRFSFASVSTATDNFSDANKHREGGFGPVHKTWDLWKSGRGEEVKDPTLEDISSINILLRYINIGLLCVEEIAANRPTMFDVVSMLSNELALVPSPKQPAFSTSRSVLDTRESLECWSKNDMTISILEAR